jgi:DoxX-like protein
MAAQTMDSFFRSDGFRVAAQVVIGSVWIFHGLYSKILNGIPRHRLIVGKILGEEHAGFATRLIGTLEMLLGIWAWTGWQPVGCAAVQTAAIVAMNSLEIYLARDLLISAIGMVLLNVGFLSLVWLWAFVANP